jgi:hypothetical protein
MIPRRLQRSASTGLLTLTLLWATPLAAQQTAAVDHGLFTRLLHAHVTDEGLVDYDAFAESLDFTAYLESLAAAHLDTMTDLERLASTRRSACFRSAALGRSG